MAWEFASGTCLQNLRQTGVLTGSTVAFERRYAISAHLNQCAPCHLRKSSVSLQSVLGFTVAERPVFLPHFNKGDHHVFFAQAGVFVEQFGYTSVESALHLDGAAGVQGDLDDDDVVAALDVEVGRVVDQTAGIVLGDDLKAVERWDINGLD